MDDWLVLKLRPDYSIDNNFLIVGAGQTVFLLLVWIYPGYQMWAGNANAVYVFSFGLFFVGTWLLRSLRRAGRAPCGAFAWHQRCSSMSFELNQLMVL